MIKYGVDIEHLRDPKSSIFISCFSECGDDLRQWMPYAADGKGMAIGFQGLNKTHNITDEPIIIIPVCYKNSESKKAYVRSIFSEAFKIFEQLDKSLHLDFTGRVYMGLIHDLIACKSENYKDEKEWRLFYLDQRESFDSKVKFRVTENIMRPYIDVKFRKESVLDIVLGPKAEHMLNEHALKTLIRKGSYTNTNIGRSKIAYR